MKTKINEEALEQLRKDLELEVPMTLQMLGRVFGEEFWILIIISMLNTPIMADKISITVNEIKK